MTWTITLDGVLPLSMNQRERTSHWTRHAELTTITSHIATLALAGKIPEATGRRAVKVTIHKTLRSRKRDDPANRDSRAKSILDALVKTGLLLDDDDAGLDWRGVLEGDRCATKCTVIEIADCVEPRGDSA